MATHKKMTSYAWLIWIIAALFYAYEFFLRVSPQVMIPDLMHAFNISAVGVSALSAWYYYAYASMQIPVGILLDRFGIRLLLTIAAFMVAVGSLLFATTHTVWVATLGRILMGLGSAFSFVGCLKLARNWFTHQWIATIIGLTNMLGALGALFSGLPLSYLVTHIGWSEAMLYAGILGGFIALLIVFIIQDEPLASHNRQTDRETPSLWHGLKHVIRSKSTWVAAIYGGLLVAPISAFTELWASVFLMQAEHLTKMQAALASSSTFLGIAIGGPVIGLLSGYLCCRKPLMFLGTLGAAASLLAIIYIPHLPLEIAIALLFAFGFCSSNMLLIFAINSENNPPWATGVAIGFTNMLVMAGGTVFQPLVGVLLDLSQPITAVTITQLPLSAYQKALWLLPACQLLALPLLLLLREHYTYENNT